MTMTMSTRSDCWPKPPQLPCKCDFVWTGRYQVPDLNIEVPFKWWSHKGNVQMMAGTACPQDAIHFTNFIWNGHLYTYTWKWPCLQPPFLPPLEPCAPLFPLTIASFNDIVAQSSFYVGPETIEIGRNWSDPPDSNKRPRVKVKVHHWRFSLVLGSQLPPGFQVRVPLASADIYVARDDNTKWVRVLHFGLQNVYAPHLDEWITIDNWNACCSGDDRKDDTKENQKRCSCSVCLQLPIACCTQPSTTSMPSLEQFLSNKARCT